MYFPNKPLFLRVCNTSLLKAFWVEAKLPITSIFSFSHNVFDLSTGEVSLVVPAISQVVGRNVQFENLVIVEKKFCFTYLLATFIALLQFSEMNAKCSEITTASVKLVCKVKNA